MSDADVLRRVAKSIAVHLEHLREYRGVHYVPAGPIPAEFFAVPEDEDAIADAPAQVEAGSKHEAPREQPQPVAAAPQHEQVREHEGPPSNERARQHGGSPEHERERQHEPSPEHGRAPRRAQPPEQRSYERAREHGGPEHERVPQREHEGRPSYERAGEHGGAEHERERQHERAPQREREGRPSHERAGEHGGSSQHERVPQRERSQGHDRSREHERVPQHSYAREHEGPPSYERAPERGGPSELERVPQHEQARPHDRMPEHGVRQAERARREGPAREGPREHEGPREARPQTRRAPRQGAPPGPDDAWPHDGPRPRPPHAERPERPRRSQPPRRQPPSEPPTDAPRPQPAAPSTPSAARGPAGDRAKAKPASRAKASEWTAAQKLDYLKNQHIGDCTRCGLCRGRTTVVFGVGNPEADVMFVGEAPGYNEDRQGIPFVGRAGERLNIWLDMLGVPRDTAYIANVLKCRPPNNRDPLPEEVARCSPFLHAQIRAIQPKVLIALGRFAGNLLSGNRELPMYKMRGRVWGYEEKKHGTKVPVVVTYHPSYVLRQSRDAPPGKSDADAKVLMDLRQAVEILRTS